MSLLNNIRTKTKQKAPRIGIFGEMGVGKTYAMVKMPNSITQPTEEGLVKVKDAEGNDPHHFEKAKSYDEVMENLQSLLDEPNEYKSYVLDSLSGLELLIWEATLQKYKLDSLEANWHQGYAKAVNLWIAYLKKLDELREKNYTICLIGHSDTETVDDPSVEVPYRRYVLDVHKKARPEIIQWLDCLFFAQKKKGTVKIQSNGKVETKVKQSKDERIVWCNEQIFCQAKNRYALPDELPLDWNQIRAEMLK